MVTYRELVYMVLDLLKERSDDAYYTEEHILFLADRMRSTLLEKKYRSTRNSPFSPMSIENYQTICTDVEPATMITGGCAGGWLKSTVKVPAPLAENTFTVHTVHDLLPTAVTFIPAERIPYVGHNKWLKNIIYCALSKDGYLYLHSSNPQFMYLEKIIVGGVFADALAASDLACDANGEADTCEPLDRMFPLEDDLVMSCIELIFQELSGVRYAPEDKANDAKDNLGDAMKQPATTDKTEKK